MEEDVENGLEESAERPVGRNGFIPADAMTGLSWDRHEWQRLVRRVARATRDPDWAEDHLHTAYLRLEGYPKRASIANPEAFLVRTAINAAIDRSRNHGRKAAACGLDPTELADDHPLQFEILQVRQRLERVQLGLARLSPRTRDIFLMHRNKGMKYREIAGELGITVSAVEKHIAKATLFLTEWTQDW